MSKWITDRLPDGYEITNEGDVWVYDIDTDEYYIRNWEEIKLGQPWMEIPPPPTYVKPKRYTVSKRKDSSGRYQVYGPIVFIDHLGKHGHCFAWSIPTREAAERIAAIYEEVMP